MNATATRSKFSGLVVALEVTGLNDFVRMEGASRRFEKDVIRAGDYRLPDGRLLQIVRSRIDAEKLRSEGRLAAGLDELAENTNEWIRLGQKVWFPEGDGSTDAHNSVASLNRGYWEPSFRVEGDALVGVVDVDDDSVAAKMGKTIRDVSAAIVWGARTTGDRVFECVIEHVCATSFPVVPQQGNFVPLARDVRLENQELDESFVNSMADLASKDGYTNEDGTFVGGFDGCVLWAKNNKGLPDERARALCAYIGREAGKIPAARKEGSVDPKKNAKLAADDGAADGKDGAEGAEESAATMSPTDAKKILAAHFGLELDADWSDVVKAVLEGDDDDDDYDANGVQGAGPGMMSKKSSKLARAVEKAKAELEKKSGEKIAALEARANRERKRWADEKVSAAKKRSNDAGVPLEKEVEDRVRELLSRGDEASEKDAELLLRTSLARVSDRSTAFASLANPGRREGEPGNELQDAILERRGYVRTTDGDIVKKQPAK